MNTQLGTRTAIHADTLADLFRIRSQLTPDGLAYVQYVDDDWRQYTWSETRERIARWQHAMARDGLERGARVAIMCSNRWDWVACDQAAQGLGLVTVPIYTNDRPDNIAWLLDDAGVQLMMIESVEQWLALEPIRAELAQLKRVVCLEAGASGSDNIAAVEEWLGPEDTPYLCQPGDPDTLATIVYTSGTTGRPKGVMLSHRNIVSNVQAALRFFDVYEHDVMLSFLPLSHAFERTVGYYLAMACGTAMAFNRSIPQLAEDLVQIQPTLMISVPRIFERVYGKITDKLATESAFKQRLFGLAVNVGWDWFEYRQGRRPWRAAFLARPLLDLLVGRKVRGKLGGRLRFTVCGGAALAPEVARLFIGLGIPVTQGYGLTETSPVIAANPLHNNQPASVGLPLPGIEVKVGEHDELLTRSDCVMMGYWNNTEATARMIDADGWLHTGDKVSMSPDGHIRITGRLKDIIVLANGEKVPPGDMENAIVLDELVDQVLVIGEGKPYLSALIVPNPDAFARVAESLHLDPANEHTCCDDNVRSIFMQHVQRRTATFPGYAQVRELAVVNEPWTPENGMATPTLKLKRTEILQRYVDLAERMYAGH
ncbi:MAG: long-chain fatty acid--CoA ligase [Gammaproteobacteria bacterium]|nr:long-chain fatty acid--CoA ligase [Gammaproteobacteria bacterium]